MASFEPVHLNFPTYIEENKHLLIPPVCNKMIHNDGKLRVMIVGGPNTRKDYHINQGEEMFYMIKGDMNLKIMEQGKPKDVIIKEGEIYNLPGSVPHSPQRLPDTIGLVIERKRPGPDGPKVQLDGLRYYVDDTNEKILWQRYFHSQNLGVELKPLIESFFASEENKTRVPADDLPASPFPDNTTSAAPAPYPLQTPIDALKKSADGAAISLFSAEVTPEFKIFLVGKQGIPAAIDNECWIWQLEGTSKINGEVSMKATDTYLTTKLSSWEPSEDCVALLVYTEADWLKE